MPSLLRISASYGFLYLLWHLPEHFPPELVTFFGGALTATLLSDTPLFSILRHVVGFTTSATPQTPFDKQQQQQWGKAGPQHYGTHHRLLNLKVTGTWLNLGYWEDTDDFQSACESLARMTAEAVELGPSDSLLGICSLFRPFEVISSLLSDPFSFFSLLDVGYGCGDQDLYFWKQFKPAEIVGITSEGFNRPSQQLSPRPTSNQKKKDSF